MVKLHVRCEALFFSWQSIRDIDLIEIAVIIDVIGTAEIYMREIPKFYQLVVIFKEGIRSI